MDGRNSDSPPPGGPATETDEPTTAPGTPTGESAGESKVETDAPASPVAWRRDLGSPISADPAVAPDGAAYLGTESGLVAALSPDDGSRRWTVDAERPIRDLLLGSEGALFAVSGTTELGSNHDLRALGVDDGSERWTFAPEEWWLEPLGVASGTLYVGTADDAIAPDGQTLYALSIDDGSERWSSEIGDPSGGLVTDDVIYVPCYGRLYAYDTDSGERLWTRDVADYSYRTIAATDETVVYAGDEANARGVLTALSAETGKVRWRFDEWHATSTTLGGDALYVGGERIAAFDLDDVDDHGGADDRGGRDSAPEPRWQSDEPAFVPRVPVEDGRLYAGGDVVRAYSADDGRVEWSWSPPSGIEGVVSAATVDGTLYADSSSETDPRNRYKFGLDAGSGERRWAFEDGTELTNVAVSGPKWSGEGRDEGGLGIVGGENGVAYALSTED